MNAKDIEVKKLKVLIYGKSGTGKTTFGSTFPKPYFFDFDNGMLSLKGKDIEYDTYKEIQKAELKLKELELKCPYETIVVDSVSTMQEIMMKRQLELNRKMSPTLHEWMMLVQGIKSLFSRLVAMPQHLVITAHEEIIRDEITGEILVQPLIVGKLASSLPIYFDEVYRGEVRKDKSGKVIYQILTTATTKYSAKSRLGCLDTVEVPSFEAIIKKVKESECKNGKKVGSEG